MVTDKWDEIWAKMASLGISEDDLIEKFILGSGRGGQNLQKTSSCVYLKHIPTGTEVKCQRTRSLNLNRIYARRELCKRQTRPYCGKFKVMLRLSAASQRSGRSSSNFSRIVAHKTTHNICKVLSWIDSDCSAGLHSRE